MKATFNFDETVKQFINESINKFIVDSMLDKGESIVGEDTNTVLSELATHLKNLKDFAKKVTAEKTRYNFDTESESFKILYDFFNYMFNDETLNTNDSIKFLRIMQSICSFMWTEESHSMFFLVSNAIENFYEEENLHED